MVSNVRSPRSLTLPRLAARLCLFSGRNAAAATVASRRVVRRMPAIWAAVAVTTCLSGCGAMLTNAPVTVSDATLVRGRIHGGQQPVAGATVTLYHAGFPAGGGQYGANSGVLATTTSDAGGSFTFQNPADGPNCPGQYPITYIVATGGNAGAGMNPLIAEAAILGSCSSLSASTYINITEETTVAAAYVLAPFASVTSSGTTIGTTSTNSLGLTNTLGPANNLVNTVSGNANGVNSISGMVLPTAEINTLADILAACINTGVQSGSAGACSTLFAQATPPGGTAPIDTFQAAIDIALNPGNNVSALYGLVSSAAPYQPTLTAAPGDFVLAIQYTGGQIAGSSNTTGVVIDQSGNAYVGNTDGTTSSRSVSEITPAGIFTFGASGALNGYAGGSGFASGQASGAYLAASGKNAIVPAGLNGQNQALMPASLMGPLGLAYNNRDNTLWAGNANNQPDSTLNPDFTGTTLTHTNLNFSNGDLAGSPYTGMNAPIGVQIDATGAVWVANSGLNDTSNGAGFLTKLTPPATTGNPYTAQNFVTGQYSYPAELSFDSVGDVWVTLASTIGKFSSAGALISSYAAASNTVPQSIMIDGLGRAFVSNGTTNDYSGNGSVTVFSNTGTLLSTANGNQGYFANNTIPGDPSIPCGLAIDSSGNVWISGQADSTHTYQFVTELIGLAAPIATPLAAQSMGNLYGVRP